MTTIDTTLGPNAKNLAKRYVVICMEYQGEGEPGWPDKWAAFPSMELATAAETGMELVDNDCVYARIWDRLEDCFLDCRAADREDDEDGMSEERDELAAVHDRLVPSGLPPFTLAPSPQVETLNQKWAPDPDSGYLVPVSASL